MSVAHKQTHVGERVQKKKACKAPIKSRTTLWGREFVHSCRCELFISWKRKKVDEAFRTSTIYAGGGGECFEFMFSHFTWVRQRFSWKPLLRNQI